MTLPQRDEYTSTMMEAPFLAFGPTNQQVLVKNYSDKGIHLYDLPSGSEVRSFQEASSTISCIAITPNAKLLAAGMENRQVLLWDIQSGKELKRLAHEYPLVNLAFSPDGSRLATLDQDLAPSIWDVARGTQEQTLAARTRSIGLAWSKNGQSLYVARQPDQILRWDLANKQEKSIQLPRSWVGGALLMCSTPGHSERLLLGSAGRRGSNSAKLRLVDFDQPDKAKQFDGYENSTLYPLYVAARKQWATINTTGDCTLRYWDQAGRVNQSEVLPIGDVTLRSFVINNTGSLIALSGTDGNIHLINAVSGKLQRTIMAFPRACYATEFTLDGKYLVTTDVRFVKRFDIDTGALVNSYELYTTDPVRTVISQDGTRIVSLHYVQEMEQVVLRIIDAATGNVLAGETKLAANQQNFYVSPDGRNISFINGRGRSTGISFIEAASGKTRYQAELPQPYVYGGNQDRHSADGRWLVTSASGPEADQSAALLWQPGITREPIILTGHRGIISSCHFSHDARELLTVSSDSTMLVWDMEKLTPVAVATLPEKEYPKLWQELGNDDAAKAYLAVQRWARQPQAAEWLMQQILNSSGLMEPQQIQEWIKQLNAVKYQDRELATKQLNKHAAVARKEMEAAMLKAQSAEVKRRLSQIIEKAKETTSLSDNPLLLARAIEALELMNHPQALVQLQLLAKRTDALGREAREAALRLQCRLK